MHAFIVIPCLNEEPNLEATCRSLGFDQGAAPPNATLILVDNGSTDGTWDLIQRLVAGSAPGAIVAATEQERGYVPPRHRGILEASEIARARALDPAQVLVLQADADTVYTANYVNVMRAAAKPGALLEGVSLASLAADDPMSPYYGIVHRENQLIEPELAADDHDVIIDDKVSGFLLPDYFRWGGLRREFTSLGELHAETSRLFIRAKLQGASRERVSRAAGRASRRRIEADPALHFATAGFPRERGWEIAWRAWYTGPNDWRTFAEAADTPALAPTMLCRRNHSRVLLGLLPAYVAWLLGEADGSTGIYRLVPLMRERISLPLRDEIVENTATLFDALFSLIILPPAELEFGEQSLV